MTVRCNAVLLIAVVAILAAAPFWAASFTVTLLNYIGIYALVALGVVLLTGVAGLTSFGQAAFVGIGAYATAWLTTVHSASPWLGLVFALVLTGAVAALPIWLEFMQGALAGKPVEDFQNVVPLEKVALTKTVKVDTPDSAPTEASEEPTAHDVPAGTTTPSGEIAPAPKTPPQPVTPPKQTPISTGQPR